MSEFDSFMRDVGADEEEAAEYRAYLEEHCRKTGKDIDGLNRKEIRIYWEIFWEESEYA